MSSNDENMLYIQNQIGTILQKRWTLLKHHYCQLHFNKAGEKSVSLRIKKE